MGLFDKLFGKDKDAASKGPRKGGLPKMERPESGAMPPVGGPAAKAPARPATPPAPVDSEAETLPDAPAASASPAVFAEPSGELPPAPEKDRTEHDLSDIDVDLKGGSSAPPPAARGETVALPAAGAKPSASAPDASSAAPPRRSSRRKRSSIARKRLGNLLLNSKMISPEQLKKALTIQSEKGGLIGQILVEMGACNNGNVGAALTRQRTITSVELADIQVDPEAARTVTRTFCERHKLIPFQKIGQLICVAMSNVLDSKAKEDLKEATKAKLKIFDAPWPDIQWAIETYCTHADSEVRSAAEAEAETGGGAAREAATPARPTGPAEEEIEIELPEEDAASTPAREAPAAASGDADEDDGETLEALPVDDSYFDNTAKEKE